MTAIPNGLLALVSKPSRPGAITHDFIDYITSDRILVGAEIEKIIAILTVTVILALAISRAGAPDPLGGRAQRCKRAVALLRS